MSFLLDFLVYQFFCNTTGDIKQLRFISDKFDEQAEFAITSIVFSAFTAETFINYYAVEIKNISANFYKLCDKLDTTAKWIIFPKFIVGQDFRGSNSIEMLQKLMSKRHKLAHYKVKKLTPEELISDTSHYIPLKEAEDGLKTIRLLLNDLSKIDTDIDLKWLDL